MSANDIISQLYASINSQFTIGNNTFFDSRNDMLAKAEINALGLYLYSLQIQQDNFSREVRRPGQLIAPNIGLAKKTATPAKGFISFQGVFGSSMLAGTQIKSPSGLLYTTLSNASVSNISLPITTLTSDGLGLITVTTSSAHNLATGLVISISGVANPLYNATSVSIIVTDINKFTFQQTVVAGSSSGGVVTGTLLSVEVQSQSLGSTVNIDRGTKMSLLSTIVGINNDGYVQYTKILGGADEELDADFDIRTQENARSQPSLWNADTIINFVKLIPGVTRVFVKDGTAPNTIIRFMRDDDVNPFPDAPTSTDVKNKIINGFGTEQPIFPLGYNEVLLSVSAPINNPCNIAFTYVLAGGYSIDLRDKINQRLATLFKDTNIANYEIKVENYLIQQAVSAGLGDDNTLPYATRQLVIAGVTATYLNVSFVDSLATLGTVTYV